MLSVAYDFAWDFSYEWTRKVTFYGEQKFTPTRSEQIEFELILWFYDL